MCPISGRIQGNRWFFATPGRAGRSRSVEPRGRGSADTVRTLFDRRPWIPPLPTPLAQARAPAALDTGTGRSRWVCWPA